MEHYLIRYNPPRKTFADDITDEEQRIIGDHFGYLQNLLAEKKLVIAGRTDDAEVGIVVVTVDSETEARTIMQNDPAVREGIFTGTVKLFRLALIQNEE